MFPLTTMFSLSTFKGGMKFTGNTILITGSGSGIGRGLAEAFHSLGNKVIVAGRRKDVLDQTSGDNPGMISVLLDVEKPEAIQASVLQVTRDHPRLNVLINNAGIMRPEDLKALCKPHWEEHDMRTIPMLCRWVSSLPKRWTS